MNKIKQNKCPTVVTEPKSNRKMAEIVENETPLTRAAKSIFGPQGKAKLAPLLQFSK